jgi:hypothetical protein
VIGVLCIVIMFVVLLAWPGYPLAALMLAVGLITAVVWPGARS